jgi:hypothetical protein
MTYSKATVEIRFQSFSRALREEIEKVSANTIILSDEGLISLSEGSIREFKEFLECEFSEFEIHIVMIVREPVSFFTSRCQQFISNRYFDKTSIQEFLEGRPIVRGESRADNIAMNPTCFYSKPIGTYDRIFNNVDVLKFEEAILDEGGLTHYFLKTFDLNISLTDVRKNESRSDKAIELIAYINNKLPFGGNSNGKQLRRYDDLAQLSSISGDKFRLPNILVSEVYGKTTEEVKWLQERCAINYASDPSSKHDETIIWDEIFFEEIVRMYPSQRLVVQVAILSFVRERHALQWDSVSAKNLKQIRNWITSNYPYRSKLSLSMAKGVLLLNRYILMLKRLLTCRVPTRIRRLLKK